MTSVIVICYHKYVILAEKIPRAVSIIVFSNTCLITKSGITPEYPTHPNFRVRIRIKVRIRIRD